MPSLVTALTEAVADGQELDWSSLDLARLDAFDRVQLEELRAVADIGRCLATLTTGASSGASSLAPEASGEGPPMPASWRGLTLVEHVGRGRFGDVFRAWDPATERHVALKLLRRATAAPDPAPHVVREARLMGRVRHPNVAIIYGAARQDGWTGLWMEYVEGRTLEAELRQRGPFSAEEAARVGIELCRALGAVYAAGLVHRDVKAQNVMREAGGRVVLGDFGTGLEIADEDAADAPLAGTPVYLAPELWNRQPATPLSDLYSLGVLLFHLVTGSFPVRGRSPREIRQAHARCQRTALRTIAADMPDGFVDIVERALAVDPAERFANVHEMEHALALWLTPSDAPQRTPGAAPRPAAGRRRWLLPVGATTAAAAVLVLIWLAGADVVPPARGARATLGPDAAGADLSRRLNRVSAPTEAQFWGQPSPDGRTHTFVDMDGDLGIFDTLSGELHVLTEVTRTGGFAFQTSTFSPAGDRIAYGWQTADGMREVRVIETRGGDPRTIWQSRDEIAHPIDWGAAGDRIVALFEQRDGRRGLGVMAAGGSPVTMVASVGSGFSTAQLAADGRLVFFDDLQHPASTSRDIFAASVDGPGERVAIVASESDDFGPLWTPDHAALVFISDRTGEPSVWSVPMDGGAAVSAPAILHRNVGRVTPNGIANDGTFYYRLQTGLVDIYEATLDLTRQPAVSDPRPVAPAQVGSKLNAAWSPDGRRLVYVALPHAGAGSPNSRRLAILDDASRTVRLLDPPLSYYLIPRWSPDGSRVLLKGIDLTGQNGIFVVEVATGAMRTAAVVDDRTPQDIGPVQWGRDSDTLLFTRQGLGLASLDLRTGRERLLFDFASEGISAITPMPGFGLSPDGGRLAYSAHRRTPAGRNETVLRVKTMGEPTRDLIVGGVRFEDWSADGHLLYTQFEEGQHMTLWVVSPDGGDAIPTRFEMHGLRNVNLHPDGRRIAFTAGFPGSEVWALANFLP
jgi:Tol biopolymer transport system component